MRVATEIALTREEQAELTRLAQSKLSSARLVHRARIILLAAGGMQNKDIAAELTVGRVQISRWRERYLQFGIAGIERDLPRGAPSAAVSVARLVRMTTPSRPEAAAHWSTRKMAAALGISPASVSSHWQADGLKPHRVRDDSFERDARLVESLDDIEGLYVSPSSHALVLCCDQANPIQAPDRTQPAPTRKKERSITLSLDYLRHGSTTLFAALRALEGHTFFEIDEQRPHIAWLSFLGQIERQTARDKMLHVIVDNHGADNHPAVQKWLARHERIHVHTLSATEPWLQRMERFLSAITDKRLRQGVFQSASDLIAAIEEQLEQPNAHAKPFTWIRDARGRRRKTTRAVNDRMGSLENGTRPAGKARQKPMDSPKTRLSVEGESLRDDVTTLKRERILREAAKLFFEYGYLQTSVDAIAERLGATKPFVYYHFNSKADILVEICERSNRDALAAAESAMSAQGSPRVRLEQFLREFTDVVLKQHQLVAIYFREQISLPKDAADRINHMRKLIDSHLSSLLREGIDSGDFLIEDPRMGALVIAGMSSYAFAWYREQGRLDQKEVTNRIVKMALKLVSASPSHRPAYGVQSATGA